MSEKVANNCNVAEGKRFPDGAAGGEFGVRLEPLFFLRQPTCIYTGASALIAPFWQSYLRHLRHDEPEEILQPGDETLGLDSAIAKREMSRAILELLVKKIADERRIEFFIGYLRFYDLKILEARLVCISK